VVEGAAEVKDYRNTDTEEMRKELREVFRACGDNDHPDWEEYDQAMVKQDAVIVLVEPQRVYGMIR
jgi:preprotein translocase subunit Sss1